MVVNRRRKRGCKELQEINIALYRGIGEVGCLSDKQTPRSEIESFDGLGVIELVICLDGLSVASQMDGLRSRYLLFELLVDGI